MFGGDHTCKECGKSYARKWTLDRHMEKEHNSEESEVEEDEESDVEEPQVIKDMVEETEGEFKERVERKAQYLQQHEQMDEVEAGVEAYNDLLPRMHRYLGDLLVRKLTDFKDMKETTIYKEIVDHTSKYKESMDTDTAISVAVNRNRHLLESVMPEMEVTEDSDEEDET